MTLYKTILLFCQRASVHSVHYRLTVLCCVLVFLSNINDGTGSSETRWASHKRAVDSVYINLPAIVTSLKRISDGELLNIKLKTISETQGLLFQIMNFKFSFLLVLWKNILGKVNILSNYLQNSKIDLITAHDMFSTCFLDISSLRNEEHFLKIKCNATELCGQFGGNNNFEQGRIRIKKKIHGENNLENIIESAD